MSRIAGNWFFVLIGLPMVLLVLVIFVFGSRLLINPKSVEITPCGTVVVVRNYPMQELFGTQGPWVQYSHVVIPMTPETNKGMTCREDNGQGQRYNHDGGRGFGRWTLDHFAKTCMQDPLGFKYQVRWRAYLFGILPLRPVEMSTAVVRENGWKLCPLLSAPEKY